MVGEGGHQLTVAQAQHLALARLWLARAPVVILDEATAEAGSAASRDLERAALAAIRGRTALVVAHRLSQAEGADAIAVLSHGRLVELGTHDELLARNGAYATIRTAWAARGVHRRHDRWSSIDRASCCVGSRTKPARFTSSRRIPTSSRRMPGSHNGRHSRAHRHVGP